MLVRFAVENFRSLKDRQELSLVASRLHDRPDLIESKPELGSDVALLRTAAVYGANASGKTNLLNAISAMRRAIVDSHSKWRPDQPIPYSPYQMEISTRTAVSTWEVELLLGSTRLQYGFTANQSEFVEEWLYAFPNRRRQIWFQRTAGNKFDFGKFLQGENKTIESVTRKNSLFLSAAAQLNHQRLRPLYDWFASSLRFINEENRGAWTAATAKMCSEASHAKRIIGLLAGADLGIRAVKAQEIEPPREVRDFISEIGAIAQKSGIVHRAVGTPLRITFQHAAPDCEDAVEIDIAEESRGTRGLFSLLGPVVAALDTGGTVVIDELDASLHPLLAMEVVKLFNNVETNSKGAQLVFNTHDTNLLDATLLRRDQVWFTEKDRCGATHLYPLTDFKPRKQENLQRGYLQGRYGAVPFLGQLETV